MQKGKDETRKKRADQIVVLEDLTPRKDVMGGSGKIVFGQGGDYFSEVEEEKRDKKK